MLNDQLKVAALPIDIVWGDREENLMALERGLASMPAGTDIVVVPELFTTGFIHDADSLVRLAERTSGETIARLHRLAAQYNVALAGSYLCNIGGLYYNRGFFIEPSGDEMFYDKRHLFSLSPEASVYRPGDRRSPVVRFRGWNIAMIVCYDLRFPVWCRNIGQLYDIMLVPANWPHARGYAWEHLLIARAIENQAYYIGANRSGADDYGDYNDMAAIYDGLGLPIGVRDPASGMIVATIYKQDLQQMRRRLPFSADADDYTIL